MTLHSSDRYRQKSLRRIAVSVISRARESGVTPFFFVLFALALLWRPLFHGEAFFWGTPLLQFVPWQQLAASMWRSGHMPLWNPLVGCGAPLAANYQTAAFYPLNVLHLFVASEVALTWTVALHIVLAGWGGYRWGRSVGLDPFPAFVGGLALQGSGFLVARAALFPSIALTFPWIAIWLWRVEILVQHSLRRGGSECAGLRATSIMGLVLGLGLLAGHAQTAFYGGVLVAAYAAFRAVQEIAAAPDGEKGGGVESGIPDRCAARRCWLSSTLRTGGLFFLSLILGLGLAAVQLLPTAELLLHSQRPTGLTSDTAMTYSFWPWRLITLFTPGLFGYPARGTYWGYGAHWEDALYVGLLPLLLVGAAVVHALRPKGNDAGPSEAAETANVGDPGRAPFSVPSSKYRGLTLFWAFSAVVSLMLALGDNLPLFPFLFHHVPGFSLFQAPARWLAVVTVALALLSGIGLQHWVRGHRSGRKGPLGITVGVALVIGGLIGPRLAAGVPPGFGPGTVRLGAVLTVAGGLAYLGERSRGSDSRAPIWWRAAIGGFIALDLLMVGWLLVPSVDRSLYEGQTRTTQALAETPGAVRLYWPSDPDHENREYDAEYRMKFDYLCFRDFGPDDAKYWRGMREDQIPNAGMLDGLASANNFDPLVVKRYADVLDAAVEAPHLLAAMGVTHVASDRTRAGGDEVHSGSSASFYRLPDAPGRAWVVPEARIVKPGGMLSVMRSPSFDPAETVLVEEVVQDELAAAAVAPSVSSLVLRDGPNRVRIRAVLDLAGGGRPGYLLGQISTEGWWYYFPIAFAVKTPVPTLLGLILGTVTLVRRPRRADLFIGIPPLLFFAALSMARLNLGYRHLLPVIPFLALHIGRLAEPTTPWFRPGLARPSLFLLLAWLGVGTVALYPHFLAYFNPIGGGPENGWRILVDSNIDWGQDLIGLRRWMEREDVNRVRLSWFGSAPPEAYGVPHERLPGLPHGYELWQDPPFDPDQPEPGVYAISVTNLVGVVLPDPTLYGWFMERTPDARIGHSVFIYRVGTDP